MNFFVISLTTVDSINENHIRQCAPLVISPVFVSSIFHFPFFFFFRSRTRRGGGQREGGRRKNIKNFFHKASSRVETPLDRAWKPAPCSFKRILAGFSELVQTVFRDFPFFLPPVSSFSRLSGEMSALRPLSRINAGTGWWRGNKGDSEI